MLPRVMAPSASPVAKVPATMLPPLTAPPLSKSIRSAVASWNVIPPLAARSMLALAARSPVTIEPPAETAMLPRVELESPMVTSPVSLPTEISFIAVIGPTLTPCTPLTKIDPSALDVPLTPTEPRKDRMEMSVPASIRSRLMAPGALTVTEPAAVSEPAVNVDPALPTKSPPLVASAMSTRPGAFRISVEVEIKLAFVMKSPPVAMAKLSAE